MVDLERKAGIIQAAGFVFSLLVFLIGLTHNVDLLFGIVIVLWINLLAYALSDIPERSVLMSFLLTFFLFVLGRDFIQSYFDYQVEPFEPAVNSHAYFVYLLALLSLGLFHKLFTFRHVGKELPTSFQETQNIESVSRLLFFVFIGFAIAAKLVVVKFVADHSYFEYYTDYSSYASSNRFITVLNMIDRMMPIALAMFLACFPSKKRVRLPLILYLIYLVISLGTQARSTAMLGVLFLLVYFLFRQSAHPEEKWLSKKIILLVILCVPVLAVLGAYINSVRGSAAGDGFNIFTAFVNFFYDQGVTSNVIKRAYMHQDQLDPNTVYTLEFLRSGIFARLLGYKPYYGNSIEHALYGGSFAHSLGYIVLGDKYLAGQGTGSSYMAEFFQDFGYIGVIFGTCIYAFMISRITNNSNISRNVWIRGIQLYLIPKILWAPRGSFADIIASVVSAPCIMVFLIIWFLAVVRKSRRITINAREIVMPHHM